MNKTFIIERTLNAPRQKVWQALTDKTEMKQWYIDLPEFKPEVGFEFTFLGGKDENNPYKHICRITEVIPERKISYSWVYDGYPGYSVVTFELFDEGNETRVKLTHDGLETFPASNPDLATEKFAEGWTSSIGTSLKEFVEKSS